MAATTSPISGKSNAKPLAANEAAMAVDQTPPPMWFQQIAERESQNPIGAMTELVGQIDKRFKKKDFRTVDRLLEQLAGAELSNQLLVGLLSATFPGARHLKSRPNFYVQAFKMLLRRGRNAKKMIGGLAGNR